MSSHRESVAAAVHSACPQPFVLRCLSQSEHSVPSVLLYLSLNLLPEIFAIFSQFPNTLATILVECTLHSLDCLTFEKVILLVASSSLISIG